MNSNQTTNAPEYDFFVSYARSDDAAGWISRFVEDLLAEHRKFAQGRELKPFFDRHAITTGADWQHYLAGGVARSKLFLAFISPAYFASPWCRKEWHAWMEAEIARHILTAGVRPIYIVEVPGLTGEGQLSEQELARNLAEMTALSPADKALLLNEVPNVVKHLRRRQLSHNQPFCDVHAFFNAGLDALRREDLRQTLEDLARDIEHHADLLARADASLSTVPPYNRKFTGRLDELLTLRERLVKDDRTGVITGVHGLGGIGKTELAFAYAQAFASAYPGGRFHIACENRPSLRDAVIGQTDFTALFRDRISDEERMQPDAYFAAVQRCLRERLNDLGHILLVLDNVADPAMLTRDQTDSLTVLGPQLHLLATTRLAPPASGKGAWLTLGRLPEDDAMELLEKHRPFGSDAERDAARSIVQKLGGFTLAVELVAAYLAAHEESTDYVRLAEGLGLDDLMVIGEDADVELCRHNQERRLTAVLGPVLDSLTPAERRTLEYAALLPADCVPLPWLRALVVADFPDLGNPGRLSDPWTDLWRHLEKLALFTRSEEETAEPKLMRVHRLVQDLTRRGMADHDLAACQQAINALVRQRAAALEKETRWQEARWEIEPFEALAYLWAKPAPIPPGAPVPTPRPPAHERATWILNQAGLRRHDLAEWSLAEPLMRRALEIDVQRYGVDHPEVAIRLSNLAVMLKSTNRLREAETLYRRALAIDEQNYGEDHPEVATCINNLAQLLQDTNRLEEAEPLMRRALAIYEHSFGEDHPNVATALDNLASLLQETNRLDEAEPLMRRALDIDVQSYGEIHPNAAMRFSSLASLLSATNRLAEAEPLMRRALDIDVQSYGENHPKVAIRFSNLASLLYATNRLAEAEPLMRCALAIDTQSYGENHPNVAIRLNNLAALLYATNRMEEAEPLMRHALAIDEQSYGENHPKIANHLNNLAGLFKATNRLAKAELFLRRALAIVEQSCGADHPKVATRLNNLATLLQDTNRLAEAEPLYRRALAIDEQSYGKDHPDVATDLNNLATLFQDTNRSAGAERLLRRALAIDEQSYGEDHPDVARDLNNLAWLLQATNRLAEADPLMRRHVEIFLKFTRATGHPHPHLQAAFGNYAGLLRAMGKPEEEIRATLSELASRYGLALPGEGG